MTAGLLEHARVGGERRRRVTPRALAPALTAVTMLSAGCGGEGDRDTRDDGEVVVMAASSLTDVMETLYDDSPLVIAVIAGSSTLVAQLAAGAGADVLITASAATMERATSDGSVQGEPMVIATNSLVLATASGNPGQVAGLADLARDELLVGLCAVEAPCGALARQALDEAAIMPAVDTLEPNVRALASKLSLGELDAGLVYSTDAARAGLPTTAAPGLHGHVTRYYIASVSAEPSPAAQTVIDDFTGLGRSGFKALHAYGFGQP